MSAKVRYIIGCGLFILYAIKGVSLHAATLTHEREARDTIIAFRFVPGRLMFYSPYKGNEKSIPDAYRLIDRHRSAIERGDAVVVVHGFCASFPTEAANRRAARNRSNQVKSWFITHHGMKEDYYRTRNHTEACDRGIPHASARGGARTGSEAGHPCTDETRT